MAFVLYSDLNAMISAKSLQTIKSRASNPEYITIPDVNFPSGRNCARMRSGY